MPNEHRLQFNTLTRVRGGIIAECTCGWKSTPSFTSLLASWDFIDHQREMEDGSKLNTRLGSTV